MTTGLEDTIETVPIRADVPVSMHPSSLIPFGKVLNQEGTIGVQALAAAREALTTAYTAFSQVEDAVKSLPLGDETRMIGGRPTKVSAGAIEELVQAVGKSEERVIGAVQRRYDELRRHREALNTRVANALDVPSRKTPEGLAVAGAIWAHVKSLPSDKRMSFLTKAVEDGDKTTVAAVLHAPAYLSGMTDKQMATLRHRAAHVFAPTDAAQLEAVEAVMDRVAAAGSRVVERYGRVREMASPSAAHSKQKIKALAEGK